jgi:hypothetical protein
MLNFQLEGTPLQICLIHFTVTSAQSVEKLCVMLHLSAADIARGVRSNYIFFLGVFKFLSFWGFLDFFFETGFLCIALGTHSVNQAVLKL